LKNFVANMVLEQPAGKINYERIISEIVDHIMTFCMGYKAAYQEGIDKVGYRDPYKEI
jgi:hypothetical protein